MASCDQIVPKLLEIGEYCNAILMCQALKDVNYCCSIDQINTILNVPAEGLLARILRYINGESLKIPEALNDEKYPFQAIKHAYCEDWEAFNSRGGDVSELEHLRAYFWDEPNCEPRQAMAITHFSLKKGLYLRDEDDRISRRERAFFIDSGYKYEEN